MQIDNPNYNRFHLVREMYDTIEYIKSFKNDVIKKFMTEIRSEPMIMLTGEGSSRIFPAMNVIHHRLLFKSGPIILTEGSTDLTNKDLSGFVVIGASNSGRTKEVISLFKQLKDKNHPHLYGLTCNIDTILENYTDKTFILETGIEMAIAATKSVVAQGMFYDALLLHWHNREIDTLQLSGKFAKALNTNIDQLIIDQICKAETVYFSGSNNGVAKELTLKANEIIRKKSAYLPGTYLFHGVEEVLTQNDVIILVDVNPDDFEKIRSTYTFNVGTPIIAFSSEPTPFETINIPASDELMDPYIKLATGWNLLVEAGLQLELNIDKPIRARKIGYEAGAELIAVMKDDNTEPFTTGF